MKRVMISVFLLALGIAGCSKKNDGGPPNPVTQLTYADVKAQVLGPSCFHCHSDGSKVPLNTFALVNANLDKIKQLAVMQKAMPPKKPLDADKLGILSSWIQGGAPQGTPETLPPPTPLVATYASIHEKLIGPICAGCHSQQGPGKKVPLATLQDLLAAPGNLVVPGHPEQSHLFLAVSAPDTDKEKMPPAKSIMRPLAAAELDVVKTWILNGAPADEIDAD